MQAEILNYRRCFSKKTKKSPAPIGVGTRVIVGIGVPLSVQ
nr:MAG TPA: hypothetical protein [Caudoviricetes sp.]